MTATLTIHAIQKDYYPRDFYGQVRIGNHDVTLPWGYGSESGATPEEAIDNTAKVLATALAAALAHVDDDYAHGNTPDYD